MISHYLAARSWVASSRYAAELEWQRTRSFDSVTESQFIREAAWVILNSGFREQVIRKHFNYISLCYFDWESAGHIADNSAVCIDAAMPVFGNRKKLTAITEIAAQIRDLGYAEFAADISERPIEGLASLPYIGTITAHHLAKNVGFNVAKADRHLVRVASRFGYECVNQMCSDICSAVGDCIAVADIVLWRFEVIHGKR